MILFGFMQSDRKLLLCLQSPHVLHSRCCLVFGATASCQTGERRTLDRKKIYTPPVLSSFLFRSSDWDEDRKGGTSGISSEYLFNILIGNDKHSGAFSPSGEIKESEFHETRQYGFEPNGSRLTLAN